MRPKSVIKRWCSDFTYNFLEFGQKPSNIGQPCDIGVMYSRYVSEAIKLSTYKLILTTMSVDHSVPGYARVVAGLATRIVVGISGTYRVC